MKELASYLRSCLFIIPQSSKFDRTFKRIRKKKNVERHTTSMLILQRKRVLISWIPGQNKVRELKRRINETEFYYYSHLSLFLRHSLLNVFHASYSLDIVDIEIDICVHTYTFTCKFYYIIHIIFVR